ncbi:MAG: hypothetical protein ACJAWV_002189 [Flammeovirgaceae bacterium]|jgi:hypothetical protein
MLIAPLVILISCAPLAIPFSSKSLGHFLMNISFPFLFVQLVLMMTFIYFMDAQNKTNSLLEIALHLIPVVGYLLYMWFLPKLARKVMVKEARQFQ